MHPGIPLPASATEAMHELSLSSIMQKNIFAAELLTSIGGAPIKSRQRRRRADARRSAAAAHTKCRRRRRGAAGAGL